VKILITNIVTLNVGDAAILYAMIDLLRVAFGNDTQFIVYDKHGDVPSRYYPEFVFRKLLYTTREATLPNRSGMVRRLDALRFRLGLWSVKHNVTIGQKLLLTRTELADLLEYKTADLIVSSGGTYLVENYSLTAAIFDYQISLYLNRPLAFFTQSLGPFSQTSNRNALRPIFDNSITVLVRDRQSLRNLQELGVSNAHVHLAADAAFALSDVQAIEAAKKTRIERLEKGFRVAVSVREWRHFKTVHPAQGMDRYRKALCALSEHLVEKHRATITYISTCQGIPEYWTEDSKLAQSIVGALSPKTRKSVSVDSNFHSPRVLAQKLKEYDLVVATRMHMAILALGVGTPVLPIAYEFKMQELFERLRQRQWVQDIETITGDGLISVTDEFLRMLPEIRNELFTAVEKEQENAATSGHILKQAFDQWRERLHK